MWIKSVMDFMSGFDHPRFRISSLQNWQITCVSKTAYAGHQQQTWMVNIQTCGGKIVQAREDDQQLWGGSKTWGPENQSPATWRKVSQVFRMASVFESEPQQRAKSWGFNRPTFVGLWLVWPVKLPSGYLTLPWKNTIFNRYGYVK